MKIKLSKTDFLINGGIAILMGFFFYYKSQSYWVGGLVAIFMFGYLVLSEVAEVYLGAKRQVKILDSKAFMYLRLNGFRKISQEGTIGLLGEYKGFWMQVYYTNAELFRGKNARIVVFAAHYKIDNSGSEQEQAKRMETTFNAHKTNMLKIYMLEWYADVAVYKISVGLFNPSEKKLMKHLNRFMDILQQEGFEARTQDEVYQSLNL
jgi:hypothetical protein